MKKPLAIFDMDGTIRDAPQNARAHQIQIIDGIAERIRELKRLGYFVIGVTNQAGVSRGEIRAAEVEETNERTCELLGDAAPEKIYYCPHYGPKDGRNCDCKKPAPGMVLSALNGDTTLDYAIVIGNDTLKDGGLAAGLALPYIPVQTFRTWPVASLAVQISRLHPTVPVVAANPDNALGTTFGLIIGSAAGFAVAPLSGGLTECSPDVSVDERAAAEKAIIPWTHDAAMAMIAAHSCCHNQIQVPSHDGIHRTLKRWSMNGICFDDFPRVVLREPGIEPLSPGRATRALLFGHISPSTYYERNPDQSAGNGALVRCAPISLFSLNSVSMLIANSRSSARETHADPRAQSSCVILNLWLREILANGTKDAREYAVGMLPSTEREVWNNLREIERRRPAEIKTGTYTVHTLEAAAWAFLTTESFQEAVEKAVTLGGDADSVGAVAGALAGAYYGLWKAETQVGSAQYDHRTVQYHHYVERLTLETTLRGICEYISSSKKHAAITSA